MTTAPVVLETLAQRLRRSLVPSITIAWVTPGWTSTSRSKRRSPLSPRAAELGLRGRNGP
jgi:hypothetical protein